MAMPMNAGNDSKKFESNEFYYEKIKPNLQLDPSGILGFEAYKLSALALRHIIELAYREGKKDMLNTVEENVAAQCGETPFTTIIDELRSKLSS